MKNSQVILHITDVHFSVESTHDADSRTLALKKLGDTIAGQPKEWHPSIICLTGDLAYRGKREEYGLAGEWLATLMNQFGLSKESLFICAGNHDVDRDRAGQLARPGFAMEADKVLAFPPVSAPYAEVFRAYSEWAKQFGIRPYLLGTQENYLVGQRTYENISFVALNTAWCCKDDFDKEKLWIGLPQLRRLDAADQFVHRDNRTPLPITITLLHHPSNWLNPAEANASQGRPNVWDYLSVRSDVVLSGHAHGEVRRADVLAETALYFTGGATWQDKTYYNNFRLLRIENDGISYRTFEYDSRSAEQRWESKIANAVNFPSRPSPKGKASEAPRGPSRAELELLRKKSQAYAVKLLEMKSRALKPTGKLPDLTALQVAIAAPQEHYDPPIVPSGRLQKGGYPGQPRLLCLPFSEALSKSRRTLLLGELGTGKSTFAACAVGALQSQSEGSLAFIVPAKQLDLPKVVTTASLIDSFSHFVTGTIAPSLPEIHLQTLLKEHVETTIFLDGLDEVPSDQISSLLREFAAIPEHWPTARVVATGRPIEMSGDVYADWQIVTAAPLNDEDKLAIFENEALADGQSAEKSRRVAVDLIKRLKEMSTLDQLVSTPLAARLFFVRIAKGPIAGALTLGDLVYDAVQERLGVWGKRDLKQKTTEFFEKYFPDSQSRSALLGEVVLELSSTEHWKIAEVRRILVSKLHQLGPACEACAVEALEFFEKSGLVVVDDFLQFPVKVIHQMLRGIGIERNWSSDAPTHKIDLDQWREVGFAATVARRKFNLSALGPHLKRYVSKLSVEESFVPASAHIVCESNDEELGKHFVSEAELRKSTRIVFFDDTWDESARIIASALKIAGPIGFGWFYDKYLNPKYPFVQTGSALTGSVFREWVRLSITSVSDEEKQKIRDLVIPMLRADTMQVHDIGASAVFLVPEIFDDSERFTFLVRGLSTSQFSELAEVELRKCLNTDKRQACEAAILREWSPLGGLLWLEHNTSVPPLALLFTSIRALTEFRNDYGKRLAAACMERIGVDKWTALLRLTLTDPDNRVAVGAALALYDLGERNLVVLREPLVKALHDGAYVRKAEEILDDLLRQSGADEVKWLAKIVHDRSEDLSGGHSGELRLLLDNIAKVPEGPALLAWAIVGLGEFVLPRYPEVRQRFRDLFSGSHGSDFRSAFRQVLQSTNPVERRAAAAVLVTSFPDEESIALQVVVRATSGGLGMGWHEWEQYLLSLNFGPAPLVALKSKLDEFPEAAARFGYRLLLNNKIDLNVEQRKWALQGILEEYWSRARETELALLKSPEAATFLMSLVKSESEFSQKSADLLLQFHQPILSEEDLALCSSLVITREWWNRQTLSAQLERLHRDSTYSKAVANLGEKRLKETFSRPLLDMLRISLHDATIWDDIVWELMCKERVPLNGVENHGYWLLEAGWQDSAAGAAIGKAADKFLAAWTPPQNWSADVYQWLALLADEFVSLPKQQLEKIILSPRPIHREVTAALLFRLQKIPLQFNQRMGFRVHQALSSQPFSEQELVEITRQSDSFPSGVCERIEATIAHRNILEDEITKLRQAGSNGALIASVLAFTQGMLPNPDYVVLTLPLAALARRDHQPGCLDRLLAICRTTQFERLKADPLRKAALTAAVEKAFTTRTEIAESAVLLLYLRGYLSGQESQRFFSFILERPYTVDDEILQTIVSWLISASSKHADQMPETIKAINNSLATIVENKAEKHLASFEDGILCVLLALGFWLLSEEESAQAKAAFWRGLKILFKVRSSESLAPLAKSFEILEPLIGRVNPVLMRSAIQSGRADSDPFVRAAFTVFKAFGGEAIN
jgi:hypothetical protein